MEQTTKVCEVCKGEYEKGYYTTMHVCKDCIDNMYAKFDPNTEYDSYMVYARYLAFLRNNFFTVWANCLDEKEFEKGDIMNAMMDDIDKRFERLAGYIPYGITYKYIAEGHWHMITIDKNRFTE